MNLNEKTIGEIARDYIVEFSMKIGVPTEAYLIGSSVAHVDEPCNGERDIDILIISYEGFKHSCPLRGYQEIVHQVDFLPGMPSISRFLKGENIRLC